MRCQRSDFSEEQTQAIEEAMHVINSKITPSAETGELIIDRYDQVLNRWKCNYRGVFDDGPGKSCAAAKVDTAIAHSEVYWGGQISKNKLNEGEVKWDGWMRFKNSLGDWIIAFSDREEWQDCFYVAGVVLALEIALKEKFELPEGLLDDPKWGTAFNSAQAWLEKAEICVSSRFLRKRQRKPTIILGQDM
jgi:hypothetical protein